MIPSENVQQYIIHDLNLNELSQCLVCQPKLIHINQSLQLVWTERDGALAIKCSSNMGWTKEK